MSVKMKQGKMVVTAEQAPGAAVGEYAMVVVVVIGITTLFTFGCSYYINQFLEKITVIFSLLVQ